MQLNLFYMMIIIASTVGMSTCNRYCHQHECDMPQHSLKFSVLGDFGGLSVWPYYTYGQKKIAKTLTQIGADHDIDFHLELGDNFYYLGVQDVDDSRFKTTFEDVYKGNAVFDKPWYLLAGNHDHYGNVTGQIEYTKKSTRWTFPSTHYKSSWKLADGTTVDIVMIDTVELCGNTLDGEVSEASLYEMLTEAHSHEPRGPANRETANQQWRWIENTLNNSRADYLFVAGHYPVYSIANHGPTAGLVETLRPMLLRNKVTAYLSGHDHNMQHLQEHNSEGHTVNYLVSGAASRTDRSTAHEDDVPTGSLLWHYPSGFNPLGQLGFTNGALGLISLDSSDAIYDVWNGKGEHIYTYRMKKRSLSDERPQVSFR